MPRGDQTPGTPSDELSRLRHRDPAAAAGPVLPGVPAHGARRENGGPRKGAAMSATLSLSAVIPVYNERYLVEELVRRVLAVEIPGIRAPELVIVNDGSTDGSGEILRRLASAHPDRIRLF